MKVKIGNQVYNSDYQPVMVILDEVEKSRITHMKSDNTKYCAYPPTMSRAEIDKWMDDIPGPHEIEIKVRGRAGTGKSTVARVIEQALRHKCGNNIRVAIRVVDDNGTAGAPEEPPGFFTESVVERRLASLLDRGLNITVRTQMRPWAAWHTDFGLLKPKSVPLD